MNLEIDFGKSLYKVNQCQDSHPLLTTFQQLWTENGDYLSYQYGYLYSSNIEIYHPKKVSLSKYFNENFKDEEKQLSIEILLQLKSYNRSKLIEFNKYVLDLISEPNLINSGSKTISFLKQKSKKKVQFAEDSEEQQELNLFIGTWNMGGVDMNNNENFFDWLFPLKDMKTPDIYVIGFQEIVKLNATNIFIISNASTVENYRILLTKNLNKIGE